MSFDIYNLTITEKIKRIANHRGMQLAQLGNEFNRLYGKKYSAVSFRNKLNNGALSYDDVEKIGKILGFDVELKVHD